jgi:hypothetical protein
LLKALLRAFLILQKKMRLPKKFFKFFCRRPIDLAPFACALRGWTQILPLDATAWSVAQ